GGSGIGQMIASALVQNGVTVYIASRKLEVLEKVADEITQQSKSVNIAAGKCIAVRANLFRKSDCDALAKTLRETYQVTKLDILVNNSGMSWYSGSELDNFDEQNGWDRLMALNVKCVFYLTAALLPLLKHAANGNLDPSRVVNISSVASVAAATENPLSAPGNGSWSYASSKAAVNHLTRTLASTLA
ncbi:hypothetical protein HK096_007855, partial [Nowakowskiella sp. JEL0078]